MDSFLVESMQETPQNINWFLFGIKQNININLSLNELSCQMLVLLHRMQLFLCLKTFSLPLLRQWKWSCFYLCGSITI